jgi:NAD-dependent DNA ligase
MAKKPQGEPDMSKQPRKTNPKNGEPDMGEVAAKRKKEARKAFKKYNKEARKAMKEGGTKAEMAAKKKAAKATFSLAKQQSDVEVEEWQDRVKRKYGGGKI